jgi:hypothetical protein
MYWSNKENNNENNEIKLNGNLIAAYAATTLLRELSNNTFNIYHRSMLTTNLIDNIHNIFNILFNDND